MKLFKNIFICILNITFLYFCKNVFANEIIQNDQFVTKSYVDNLISSNKQTVISDDFIKIISDSVKEKVLKEIKNNMENKIEINKEENSSMYIPVFLNKGKTLICGSGVEIILRTGKSIVYTPSTDGIINITKGKEIFNEDVVEQNNLLIIPRSDGRGISAISDSWFLIKGSYIIK